MIKKSIKVIFLVAILFVFSATSITPEDVFATTPTKTTTTIKKPTVKKKVVKKKIVKKKEKLTLNPPLFTYDNLPHSPKPVAKKVVKKKVTTKKK